MVLVLGPVFSVASSLHDGVWMPLVRDISTQKFGNLTAIEIVGRYHREAIWECACDCGKKVRVKLGNLRSGNTKSCGCLRGKHE